jgi:hypothetical protein
MSEWKYPIADIETKKGSFWYYFSGKIRGYFYVRKIKNRIKGEK